MPYVTKTAPVKSDVWGRALQNYEMDHLKCIKSRM